MFYEVFDECHITNSYYECHIRKRGLKYVKNFYN